MSGFSRSNLVRVTVALLALATSHTSLAQEHDKAMTIQVEAQPLATALQEFSEQSGLQVAYVATLAQDVTSNGARDAATPVEALAQILDSTGLEYQFVNDDTVAIGPAAAADKGGDSDSGNGRTAGATPRPVMMAQAAVEQSQTSGRTETDSKKDEKKRPLEEIIVTGTNIRGIAPDSSPVHVYDREDIQISGAATAQDFIQTLTTNFQGGSNEEFPYGIPGDISAHFNTGEQGSLGSSVNLRGLGSGSTLVLLNGHRMAPSSGIGDFTDISMIPASALERVEVLTDGASSIYGGDAVAGVVNFILRDDFEGVETSFRYGWVTRGDMDEYAANVTGGANWNNGNGLIVYEYFNQANLSAEDRAFSELSPLPHDLLPSQERQSVLASASQEITQNLEFLADFSYSRRKSEQDSSTESGFLVRSTPSTENLNLSGGATWDTPGRWVVDLSATYSAVQSETNASGDITGRRKVDSTIGIGDAKVSGDLFLLPGGDIKLAIGSHYRTESFTNLNLLTDVVDRKASRDVYAFFGEAFIPLVGPGNAVPGIERVEINVSGRFEDYSDFGSTANPKVGLLWSPVEAVSLRGSYSTSFKPPPLGRVGASDLGASVFRTSFTNARIGVAPGDPSIADVVILQLSGTSKDLDPETSRAFTAGLDLTEKWGNHGLTFTTTWFDIKFEGRLGNSPIPGNSHPFNAPNIAFNSPESFPEGTIIFFPSQNEVSELLSSFDRPLTAPFGDDPSDAGIINKVLLIQNLSLTNVRGLDFDFTYTLDSDIGELSIGLDGTFLENFQQQAAITTPLVEQVNTLFNPVDLRLRSRLGFAQNGFSANIFANYTDDYRTDSTENSADIKSWTTFDISLHYDIRETLKNRALNNTILRLSLINAFDEAPPLTEGDPGFGIFGFDPTNASPLGRFVTFEIAKKW